ncbi:MAG: 30S ribosomal protein S4 [Verrucomicrobia bacterium]|nr:30S ribosomal protein S4 [Verrucomicrobiota bacterium]|tara:strand:+ start:327 stop:932 length:606 start_codon:yes stop_codon:yes gene_type:complete
MARYTGPKSKIARKFKEPIFGADKALEKKNYPPGQHGPNKRRGKKSEYAIQLMEKQKAKYTYGILERQFSNLFVEASRRKGITGENLLKLCESRLDNVVYRLGLASSRRAARQLVGHKHLMVNEQVVNIPSYSLKEGDIIEVRERSKSLESINDSLANRQQNFDWLVWDAQSKKGKFIQAPERAQIPENIKEQLIVELYSK